MRVFARRQFELHIGKDSANALEAELFQHAIEEVQIPMASWDYDCVRQVYKHKLRALLTAMRDPASMVTLKLHPRRDHASDGREREILRMSPPELNPDRWADVMTSGQEFAKDDQRQPARYGEAACSNCRRRGQPCHNTAYTQLQTRSADEGLTTYFLCYNCGKRWRQS